MSLATLSTPADGQQQLSADMDEYDDVRLADENLDEGRETMPIEMAINSQALDFLGAGGAKNERDMNSNILIDGYSTSSVCETDQETADDSVSTIIEKHGNGLSDTEPESIVSANQVGVVQT